MSPHTDALHIIQRHPDTGGGVAMAKLVLSLWNSYHRFAMSEILLPLDPDLTRIALAMVSDYAVRGETQELLDAGSWVYDNYPGLVEISTAQHHAYAEVMQRREDERQRQAEAEEEEENRKYRERRARAKPMHCNWCQQQTVHVPVAGEDWWRCDGCGEERQ
ncbi:hypothetical protein [Chitiniphilus eburneus]|uniref:hypothetical protein n=1 Tax=Chitiniphilus eburneus TaxID=2571148 RepID=UPI0035CEC717